MERCRPFKQRYLIASRCWGPFYGGAGSPVGDKCAGSRYPVQRPDSAWKPGIERGRLHEDYQAAADGQWVSVATSAEGGSEGPSALYDADSRIVPGSRPSVVNDGDKRRLQVEEFRRRAELHVVRRVRLDPEGPWVHGDAAQLREAPGQRFHAFVDRFTFSRPSDWSFSPSVGGFVPDAEYKAPLVLVQAGQAAFGIVPDVAALDRRRRCSDATTPWISTFPAGRRLAVGFVPLTRPRLSFGSRMNPSKGRHLAGADRPMRNTYYLLITARAEAGAGLPGGRKDAVEALRAGPASSRAADQAGGNGDVSCVYAWLQKMSPMETQMAMDKRLHGLALWDDWRTEVWGEQTKQDWLLVPLADGATGGGVRTLRWGPGPSIYLSAWFKQRFGPRSGMVPVWDAASATSDLVQQARQTVELAIRAPGRDGAFKCIARPSRRAWRPLSLGPRATDRATATRDGFLGYDMSWTAYWLLRWRAANLPDGEVILHRCRELATFLCDRQSADGMLPTRFAEDGSVEEELSRTVKAETGPVALFLLELYAQDRNARWLQAGKRGLAFLETSVIPLRQWYDFETFWSCSPRTPKLDERSHQWPANDLALGQSVAAFLSAYRVTGDRTYLDRGERILDYLLLYQQCWTNPMLRGLTGPATLLGGFTTQNSDAEWSDARQSQFGNVLLDYYRATGNVEYLERGVAAVRGAVSRSRPAARTGPTPAMKVKDRHPCPAFTGAPEAAWPESKSRMTTFATPWSTLRRPRQWVSMGWM